jgi:hydroxyacylglutathione hydrolase
MILCGFPTGVFQENCFIAGCEKTCKALVVDPGADADVILKVLEKENLKAGFIAVTHPHVDHIGAVQAVRQATGAPLGMHRDAYAQMNEQAAAGRYMIGEVIDPPTQPDLFLDDGDELKVGELRFRVLYCPGHAAGHLCFYGEPSQALGRTGVVFTGDTLFQSGIGRFDMPGGDGRVLLQSIREKLLTLPDDTLVLPGHGPETTIGREKRENPFILHPRMVLGEVEPY